MNVSADTARHTFVRRLNAADAAEDALVQILLAEVTELFEGAAALFMPTGSPGADLELTHAWHRRPDRRDGAEPMFRALRHRNASRSDFVATVFRSAEPFLAPEPGGDGALWADEGAPTPGPPVSGLIAVPLVAHEETIGVLAIARDGEAGPFDGQDLTTAELMADEAAMALRGARLIEECRSSTRELDEARATLQATLDSAADAIVVLDSDGVVESANEAMVRMIGTTSADVCGHRVDGFLAVEPDEHQRPLAAILPTHDAHGVLREVGLRRADNRVIPVEVSVNRVRGIERHLYVAVARDVSERKRSEEVLRREASADPLTGLVNRTSLHHALGRSMRRVDEGRQLALLFIDLDGFKEINDTYGHQAGDEVLQAVGRRITRSVRGGDLVARYGGDEFVVVLEADDDIEHEADLVNARIAGAFAAPFAVAGTLHSLGASLGRSIYGVHGTTISQLIAHADAAMYREKQAHHRTA